MKKWSLLGIWKRGGIAGRNDWFGIVSSMLMVLSIVIFAARGDGATALARGRAVTVWIQVTDSCKQALSGATFTVAGPGIRTTTAPTRGGIPVALGGGSGCPIQHGNCTRNQSGCTTVALNVPASGTATYTITIARTAPGHGLNLRYATCNGGSDCRHGPEVATVRVSSSGSVSATVLNHYPDGVTVTWPGGRGTFNGSQSNPIMFHEFGIGNGSIQCDGDHDADDYLTGSPGTHCDSDGDRHQGHQSRQRHQGHQSRQRHQNHRQGRHH